MSDTEHLADFEHAAPTPLDTIETSVPDAAAPSADALPAKIPTSTHFLNSGDTPTRRRVDAAFTRIGIAGDRPTKYLACGQRAYVVECNDEPGRYAIHADRCRDRFCPSCARNRSATIRQNLEPLIEGEQIRLITLTLKATDESLAQRISRLYRSFAKLRRHPVWKQGVEAAVSFLEVTRGRLGMHWHTHVHVIAKGKYIQQARLAAAWLEATGDSFIVDVRLCKSPESLTRYVTKYVTKAVDAAIFRDDDLLDEAIEALRNVRMVTTIGAWRGQPVLRYVSEDSWHFVMNWSELQRGCEDGHPKHLAIYFHLKDKPYVAQDSTCDDDVPEAIPPPRTLQDAMVSDHMDELRRGGTPHPMALGLKTFGEVEALRRELAIAGCKTPF